MPTPYHVWSTSVTVITLADRMTELSYYSTSLGVKTVWSVHRVRHKTPPSEKLEWCGYLMVKIF